VETGEEHDRDDREPEGPLRRARRSGIGEDAHRTVGNDAPNGAPESGVGVRPRAYEDDEECEEGRRAEREHTRAGGQHTVETAPLRQCTPWCAKDEGQLKGDSGAGEPGEDVCARCVRHVEKGCVARMMHCFDDRRRIMVGHLQLAEIASHRFHIGHRCDLFGAFAAHRQHVSPKAHGVAGTVSSLAVSVSCLVPIRSTPASRSAA